MKGKWFEFGNDWYHANSFRIIRLQEDDLGTFYWTGLWKKTDEWIEISNGFPNEYQAKYWLRSKCVE